MADEKLGSAVLSISLDEASAKRVFSALDDLKKKTGETAAAVKTISFLEMARGLIDVGKVGLEAMSKIIGGIVDLGERGADVDDVSNSFEVLAAQAGSTGDAMLGQLRAGVVGTMSDFDLMKSANVALGAGFVKTADDMGTLAAGARVLAKATGDSTPAAFEKLTDAMAKGRVAGLKTMGLYVDSKAAVLAYAQAHHTTVGALTEEEKASAVTTAALQALRERLKAIPPDAADFGEKIKQGAVALENFRDGLAQAVSRSPVLAAAMDAVGKSVLGAFGSGQQGVITAVVHLIEHVAVIVARVAEGVVVGAGVMVQAWYAVKTVLLTIETAVAAVTTAQVAAIAGIVDLASKVPGVGDKLSGVKLAADNFRDSMVGATSSLAEQTAEAAKGAQGHSELQQQLEKVAGVVANVGDAMEAASGQTVKLTDAVTPLGPKTAEAAAKVKDNAKEISDTLRKLSQDIVLDTKEGLDKRLQVIEFEKQAELQKARELTGGVGAAYDQMVQVISARAAQRVAIERAAGDEIKQHELQLQQEIALAQTTGTQHQLLELQQKEQAELASIEHLRITRAADFEQLSVLIHQKYADMTATVTNHYKTVEELAHAAGFTTRAELEETARKAKETYEAMLASGKFTEDELRKAHEAAEKAKAEVTGESTKLQLSAHDAYKTGVLQLYGVLSAKFKAVAIAGALIATYMAVAKAYASAPWPANLVLAAGALAAGMANVNKIRQAEAGFRGGTPGLDFMDFGSATATVLHNHEAVIPRGGGHLLAAEVAEAMPGGGSGGGADVVAAINALRQDLPRQVGRAVRDAFLLSPQLA